MEADTGPPVDLKLDSDPQSEMDRLTQLQDGIDELVHIMSVSVQYLTRNAAPKEVSPAYKVSSSKEDGIDPAEFEAERKRLVQSLLKEAKKVEFLISVAPSPPAQDKSYAELIPLQAELDSVNRDFLSALADVDRVRNELSVVLRALLDRRPA